MTPAKPQQMSGQTDDADDLIAELTKLMASEAKQSNPDSVADNVPSTQRPDLAAGARPASQPPIRIPGVSLPSAPPQAANKFDFGRPPAAATMPAPEPLANWQDRAAPKPAMTSFTPARPEPSFDAPAPMPPPVAPNPPAPPADSGGFDFDFGFGSQRPDAAPPAPKVAPAAEAPAAPILPSGHDPIADLIAAELDAAGPIKTAAAAPAPSPSVAPRVVSMPSPVGAPEAPPAPVQARVLPPIPGPAAPVPSQSAAAPRPQPSAPPLRPASNPARTVPPESDRFATAPVFGLGGRPNLETTAPKPSPDPMDEIENLIGEAVRVELSAPQHVQPIRPAQSPQVAARVATPTPSPQSTPAVPPLTTQFAPRRTSLREPDPSFHGADDAILAAAADTGAHVGHVDALYDDRAFKPKKQARRERPSIEDRRPSAFRQLIVPAVAGTLLLAAGFGLYWVLGMGHHDGGAPVLAADTTPSKQIPPKPAADATHSAVLDELSGKAPAPANEQMVSRDQTAGTDAAQVAAAQATPTAPAAATTANNDGGLANRKVRTVTVRPDGTIVSGDDTVAGAAKLPVDRPNVPAVPGAAVASADTGTATPTTADASAVAPADPADTAAVEPPTADTSAPAAATAPATAAADLAATAPATDAPVPMPRPATRDQQIASAEPTSPVNALVKDTTTKPVDLIGNLAAANADTPAAAPQPQAAAKPADATTGSIDPNAADVTSAPAHAQLASQRSQADAQASANKLQSKFGSLFNNAKLQVVQADLGAKGIYYRVVLPTSSVQIAAQICAAIRSNGGDCVAING